MLNQIIRAARLERPFYTSLLFDEYATGNAVAIIVLVGAVPVLAHDLNVVASAQAALNSLIRGGLSAVAAWAVATKIIGRDGRIPTTFRLAGFAHVAFIPTMVGPWVSQLEPWLRIGSLVWFFFAMRVVASVQFDLDDQTSVQVAGGAVLAWFVLLVISP